MTNDMPKDYSEISTDQSELATSTTHTTQDVRVAIVDDHEMFRAGVIGALQNHFTIVGQAGDVQGSIAMIRDTQPDVVLLDVHVPGGEGGGGAEIALRSKAFSPHTAFLALSVSDSAHDVGAVIRAGARGYVTKSISSDELISSIEQVSEGYAVFSPQLAGFVLSAFQSPADPATPTTTSAASTASATSQTGNFGTEAHLTVDDYDDEIDSLSEREKDVMRLIARGYTYKEVASELFISIKTVESHMSKVLRKLQLSNRSQLARWATQRHIV